MFLIISEYEPRVFYKRYDAIRFALNLGESNFRMFHLNIEKGIITEL